ncbi:MULTISPECIES: hypothetical protein [unclassified Acidisoma]|jgi:hypothetical protein|uniref:hypothetical protein n=1 Tax=unclassified Acidisoma TaxID=2634065 RepID=UPI00131AD6F6|nr:MULTISPECIES: hypothetical protein [unclassified Acidisoma]
MSDNTFKQLMRIKDARARSAATAHSDARNAETEAHSAWRSAETAVKTHKDKLDEFVVTGSTSIQNTILKHTQLRNEQSKLTRLATAAGIRNTKAAETTVKARTTERTTLRRLEATKSLLETLRLASNQAERNGDNDAD